MTNLLIDNKQTQPVIKKKISGLTKLNAVAKSSVIALTFLALSPLSSVWAQVQDFGGTGSIDWGEMTVNAVGIGAPNPNMPVTAARPMAIQAARQVAMRNALEVLKGIQLSSTTTVQDLMVSSDVITTSVKGNLRKVTESEPKYMSDKTIEITVSVPIDNLMLESLLSKEITENPAAVSPDADTGDYTGIIIDTRGLGMQPSLAPKIFDKNNKELFGYAHIKRSAAVNWGVTGWSESPEEAVENETRIGKKPLVIKASGLKNAKGDIVLEGQSAEIFARATKGTSLLSQCRIIVVVD